MTNVTLRMVGEDAGTQQLLQHVTQQLDKLDSATGKNKGGLKRLTDGISAVTLQYNGFKQILGDVERVVDMTVGRFIDGAQAARSLALATGTTTEEASRLSEVMDDMGINTDGLRTAMIAMKNAGLVPNIDTFAKLADEYRGLTDETAKVTFLTDKFGARGVELGKVFEMTGEEIRAAGEAVNESLIYDERKIEMAEKARKMQDSWNDSLRGFTNTIAVMVLPGIIEFIGGLGLLTDAVGNAYQNILDQAVAHGTLRVRQDGNKKSTNDLAKSFDDLSEAERRGAEIGAYVRDQYVDLAQTYDYAADQARILKERTDELNTIKAVEFGIQKPLTAAYEDYWQTLRDLSARADELNEEMATMQARGLGNTEAAKKLKEEYDGLIPKMDEASAAIKEQTAQLIFNQIAASLSGDAQLELARKMGILSESDYLTQKTLSALTDTFDLNKDKVIDAKEAQAGYYDVVLDVNKALEDGKLTQEEANKILDEAKAKLDALDGRVVNTTVNVTYNNPGLAIPGSGGTGGGDRPPAEQTAMGGSIMPGEVRSWNEPGYQGEMLITNSGGVIVSAADIQAALSGGNGGGNITISGDIIVQAPANYDVMALFNNIKRLAEQQQLAGLATAGR